MARVVTPILVLLMGAAQDAHCAELDMTVQDNAGAAVAEAVASLRPVGRLAAPAGPAVAVMDQRGLKFVPHVLPVQVGTPIEFPNSDQVRHHVYSFSPAKSFELRLYKAKPAAPIVFDKVGVVTLGCNIHDWMLGYVVVVDTPYFAQSDASGHLEIGGIPPGDYTLQIWHARQQNPAPAVEVVHITSGANSRKAILSLHAPDPDPAPPSELEQKFSKYRKNDSGA